MQRIVQFSRLFFVALIARLFGHYLVWCSQAMRLDDAVLIGPKLGLLFNNISNHNRYWLWHIDQGQIQPAKLAISELLPFELIWVPYMKLPNATEEWFEFDFGKVCIATKDRGNVLYEIRYEETSGKLHIIRIESRECDNYILLDTNSTCSLTVLPVLPKKFHLLGRYSSSFLVGHNKYAYIIFDRKLERIGKNRLIVIRYHFKPPNDLSTRLVRPNCFESLRKFIRMRPTTSKIITDMRAVVPLDNGEIYLFFEKHYCVTNLERYLQCDKRSLGEMFASTRFKRNIEIEEKGTTNSANLSTETTVPPNRDCVPRKMERITNPTTKNEYRAAFMIILILLISVLVIISYKLILHNRHY